MTNSDKPWETSNAYERFSRLEERLEAELARRQERNRLASYLPYPKQRTFHDLGAAHRERMFLAGNQLGKTLCAGMEVSMHLTGRYPEWWAGKRFDGPTRWWAAGVTSESCRDNPQRVLMGPPQSQDDWGTGTIPHDCILGFSRSHNVADALDSIVVRHVSGKSSVVAFKRYEAGRTKWQGETLHGVWFDEEPPMDVYTEGMSRTNATGGIVLMTLTPLLGMSEVVRMFLTDDAVKVQEAAA